MKIIAEFLKNKYFKRLRRYFEQFRRPKYLLNSSKATEGDRTHDLAFTKRLLYQLSYGGNQRTKLYQNPARISKRV
jgi:hypothetical protein